MGPIERELRRWCRDNEAGVCNPGLSPAASQIYCSAIASAVVSYGQVDAFEDVMSEAIEAAEALGL